MKYPDRGWAKNHTGELYPVVEGHTEGRECHRGPEQCSSPVGWGCTADAPLGLST